MVQKIHPQGVIWVPSSRLMWADHQKKIWQQFRPYIKKSMCKYMYQVPREDGLVCVCIAITVYIGLLYPMSTTVKIWPWEPSVYYSSLPVCWPGKFLHHRMVINNFLFYNFLKILFESCLYVLNYIHVKESYKLESFLDKSSRFFVIGLVILHF